jgi:hypothetical protein
VTHRTGLPEQIFLQGTNYRPKGCELFPCDVRIIPYQCELSIKILQIIPVECCKLSLGVRNTYHLFVVSDLEVRYVQIIKKRVRLL